MLKINTYPKAVAAFVVTLIILTLILSGCRTTQKTVTKSETNKDSMALVEANKRLEKMAKERERLESKLSQWEQTRVDFQPCPPPVNLDSLREVLTDSGCDPNDIESLRKELTRTQSKYQRLADGSLIIEGNLASVTEAKEKQEDTLRDIQKENSELLDSINRVNTKLTEAKKEASKEVTRKPPYDWYLLFFVIGVAVGMWVWNKWGEKIKRINPFK
jgi:predicted nuclease with TOPRIM domain